MNTEASGVARRAVVHKALGDEARLAIVDALMLSDRTPSELRTLVGAEWNLLAFHLDVLTAAGIIERRRSEGDGRRRYIRLKADALDRVASSSARLSAQAPLFVCTHNSARSQFAAAMWRRVTGQKAMSAGARPAPHIHPLAVTAAATHGVDLRDARPRGYAELPTAPDVVVSVCDRAFEGRPPFDAPVLHWSTPDPAARGDLAAFERAFADIAARILRCA